MNNIMKLADAYARETANARESWPSCYREEARAALQSALEAAVEKQAAEIAKLQAKLSAMEKQEPVAWLYWDANAGSRGFYKVDPLLPHTEGAFSVYAAPKVAQPLSYGEIDQLYANSKSKHDFARAIEAAHNIGGQQP